MMPKAMVRLSAGRRRDGRRVQALCFFAGANSIFYGEKLLTTGNPRRRGRPGACSPSLGLRAGRRRPAEPADRPLSERMRSRPPRTMSRLIAPRRRARDVRGADSCAAAASSTRRRRMRVDVDGRAMLLSPATTISVWPASRVVRAPRGGARATASAHGAVAPGLRALPARTSARRASSPNSSRRPPRAAVLDRLHGQPRRHDGAGRPGAMWCSMTGSTMRA